MESDTVRDNDPPGPDDKLNENTACSAAVYAILVDWLWHFEYGEHENHEVCRFQPYGHDRASTVVDAQL